MAKLIVFCSDGTWNKPGQDLDSDGVADNTNVYKFFSALAGQLGIETINLANEQEKFLSQGGALVQVAKYIHGVGDSRSPVRRLLGGAFGSGIIGRIVRGYTFISRNYEPGDRIVLVGFSRGAYTVRALAGLICGQGLLAKKWTADKEEAYRAGSNAWYQYRQSKRRNFLDRLNDVISDLPLFVSMKGLTPEDFVPVPTIAAVGVWDTVGSLGIPTISDEPRADMFRFADLQLNPKVQRGYHAVARDEQREDFIPTLWDPAPNVKQLLFAGAHGDVGGGYPTINRESGLSDIALDWMVTRMRDEVGVQVAGIVPPFAPDPLGTAHTPWTRFPFNIPSRISARKFDGLELHPSIHERLGRKVLGDPEGELGVYG